MAIDYDLLTPPQLEVLNHLHAESTVAHAARKSSIHRSTIYLWLKEENSPFRAEYERLRELQIQALDALEESLSGPDSTPAVRLRAAIYVLGGSARRPDTNSELLISGGNRECARNLTDPGFVQLQARTAVGETEQHAAAPVADLSRGDNADHI